MKQVGSLKCNSHLCAGTDPFTFFGMVSAVDGTYISTMLRFGMFIFALLATLQMRGQYDCDSAVFVRGKILSESGRPLFDAMVVNRTRQVGSFCEADGSFLIKICQTDSLQIGATGFASVRISFRDSVPKSQYRVEIRMKQLRFNLPEVAILAPRDLDAIQRDIDGLGFDERDYRTSGVNAFQSPITFLYEAFSRRERSKRLVTEMRNDDRRRELLKELFARYVEYEIIALEDHEFDAFVDFMDPGDESLKRFSQYEFIVYVKESFSAYKRYGRKMRPADYDYHLDD